MHVYDVIPQGSSLVLVCEYMETDLHDVRRRKLCGRWSAPGLTPHMAQVLARADELLSEAQIKSLMRMLLLALEHCHVHSVMHRVRKRGVAGQGGTPDGHLHLCLLPARRT